MGKNRVIFIGIILTVVLLAYFFRTSGTHFRHSDTGRQAAPAGEVVEKPGTDMTEDVPTVEVPQDKQQLIGMKLIEVAFKPLSKTIRTVGRVESDERKITTVNLKVEGWIEKLYADYSGKYVKKGDPIADIYSPELMSAQLEFINLLDWRNEQVGQRIQRNIEFNWGDRYGTTAEMTTLDVDSVMKVARQKLMLWEIPDDLIKKIEETKKPIKTLTVRSPVDGYVLQKPVVKGTRVSPGDKIVDLVDLSSVWIIADIFEPDLPLVKVGQAATISLSYFPDKKFSSKIDFIYPFLSEETRSVKVRFTVPNPQIVLKPQMFTTVEITIYMGKRLVIPENAVLDSGRRKIVYVDKGDGYFEPREIAAGLKAEGMVEVLRGLKAGERVVSSAAFLVDSESKLQGISLE